MVWISAPFKPHVLTKKKTGKLHHGAAVLSAEKSKECDTHTSEGWDINITSRCPFAHSWMGDTLQYVCYKCTRDGKQIAEKSGIMSSLFGTWGLTTLRKEQSGKNHPKNARRKRKSHRGRNSSNKGLSTAVKYFMEHLLQTI